MKKQFIFLILVWSCISCEKIFQEEEVASTDPYTNFRYLWNACNERYSYFNLKNVNWQNVGTKYEAKLFHGMGQDSLFNVLAGMLNELQDNHVNLVSDFKTYTYGIQYRLADNFDWRIIVDNYITPSYEITGPFNHNFIANRQIGYLRLATFSEPITLQHLDYILERYQNTVGLILDLRENGGGKIERSYQLLERFIESETIVQYTRIKYGTGTNAFSDPEPVNVKPHGGIRYTKNVVVLIDGGTYSSASLFALGTKAFSHITLIGNTTGGGLGIPNGGQLPNGWFYRFSITQSLDLLMRPDFENGVPPEIQMDLDHNNLAIDEILEAGIQQLL